MAVQGICVVDFGIGELASPRGLNRIRVLGSDAEVAGGLRGERRGNRLRHLRQVIHPEAFELFLG